MKLKSKKIMKGWTDKIVVLDQDKLKYYNKGHKFSQGTINFKIYNVAVEKGINEPNEFKLCLDDKKFKFKVNNEQQ